MVSHAHAVFPGGVDEFQILGKRSEELAILPLLILGADFPREVSGSPVDVGFGFPLPIGGAVIGAGGFSNYDIRRKFSAIRHGNMFGFGGVKAIFGSSRSAFGDALLGLQAEYIFQDLVHLGGIGGE